MDATLEIREGMKEKGRPERHLLNVLHIGDSCRFCNRWLTLSEWLKPTNLQFIRYGKQGIITMYMHRCHSK